MLSGRIGWYRLGKVLGFGLLLETLFLAATNAWLVSSATLLLGLVVLFGNELFIGPARDLHFK